MQIRSTGNHLPAVLPSYPLHERWRRTNNVGLLQAQAINPIIQPLSEQQGLVLGAASIFVTVGEFDKLAKRRISVAATCLNLRCIKFVIIVARSCINTKMLWI